MTKPNIAIFLEDGAVTDIMCDDPTAIGDIVIINNTPAEGEALLSIEVGEDTIHGQVWENITPDDNDYIRDIISKLSDSAAETEVAEE